MIERKEKVVVTGSGIVCGAGNSVDTVWSQIQSGETAIKEFTEWDNSKWPVKMSCNVADSNRDLVPERKLHKSITRPDMFGIYAGERAIEESGITDYRETLSEADLITFNDRSGLIVGAGGGNYTSNYDFFPLMTETNRDLPAFGENLNGMVTPMWLLRALPNNVLCHVGIRGQFKGTNACITNHIAGGIMAVTESAEAIWYGEADRVIAIGHDSIFEPEPLYYYYKMGLLSESVIKAFDQDRDGIVIGEGAGSVTLEREADAIARNATIQGEVLGYACVSEATGITEIADDGNGVERAIQKAIENAGIEKSEIGMICAHGNGTRQSDLTEAMAIKNVFGSDIPPVTSMKWAYGHLIGAAGMVDLVMTLKALREKVVPGIGTLNKIDPQIGADFPVSKQAQTPGSDVGLVVSRGFGGLNVAVLVKA